MFKKILILSLILCSIAFIADAQLQWRKFVYFENKGGLNDNLSTTEIADNEATDIQNIIFDVGGAIKKRNGYTTVPKAPSQAASGTSVYVTGLMFYRTNAGARYLISVCNADGKAVATKKSYSSTGGPDVYAWESIDNAEFGGTYSNSYLADMCIAEDICVIASGYPLEKPYKWSGTSAKMSLLSTDTDLPAGGIVEFHKNQLFVSGNSTYPSRVYFSSLGDITSWDATDFFDVESSDGSKVRGVVSAFDSLYIFKDRSIWRLSGAEKDSFVLQKMVDGIGTLSNKSIAVVNNYIYFTTAQNDIAVYDGAYTCQFISQKIRGSIGELDFARAYYNNAVAFSTYKYNDFDYYVSVTKSGGTYNNEVLLFDTQHKAWTKFSNFPATAMCVGDNNPNQNALYFGNDKGYVSLYPSSYYFDGSISTDAITAFYQTKWFKYSDIALGDKYWRLLKTYALAEDNTVVYAECKSDYEASGRVFAINLEGSQAKWDQAIWDDSLWGGEIIVIGRNEVEKGTTMFQLRYTQSSASTGFVILGWELFVEPTADRV